MIKSTDEHGATTFAPDHPAEHRNRSKPRRAAGVSGDWSRRHATYRKSLTPDLIQELAGSLGVASSALEILGIGWHANESSWTIPERNAQGKITGIVRRFRDSSQKAFALSKRGLTIPTTIADLRDPVLVVEGASDVAACLTLGLTAVGRSNNGSSLFLDELLNDREFIVVGENDERIDSDGKKRWPGRNGTQGVARRLANSLKKQISWAMPDSKAKDIRSWLNDQNLDLTNQETLRQVGAELLEALRQNQVWEQPTAPRNHDVPNIDNEHYTDLGNARRLVRRDGQNIMYVYRLGWCVWDGRRWFLDRSGAVWRSAKDTVRAIAEEASHLEDSKHRDALIKHAFNSESRAKLEAMIKLAESEPEIARTPELLDGDPLLLNVANGTINLRTGKLQPHRRDNRITRLGLVRQLEGQQQGKPIPFDPYATCPLWLRFLDEVLMEMPS